MRPRVYVHALLVAALPLFVVPSSHVEAAPTAPQGGVCLALGTVCVGADSSCQYSDLQAAIDDASTAVGDHTTIFIANNQDYYGGNFEIADRNIKLRGGLSSCSAFTTSGTTTLSGYNGVNASAGNVVSISSSIGNRAVVLRDLEIRDGGPPPLQTVDGGGVHISGSVDVEIDGSLIESNSGGDGGGIYVDGSAGATLLLDMGTRVQGNTAERLGGSGHGGGIFCMNGSIELGEAKIVANSARSSTADPDVSRGGGAYLDNCDLVAQGTGDAVGIVANYAENAGGGLFVTGLGSVTLRGVSAGAYLLQDNLSASYGGAIYLEHQSTAVLDGVAADYNVAGTTTGDNGIGGAIYSVDSQTVIVSNACVACSSLSHNGVQTLGFGGALYADSVSSSAGTLTFIRDTKIEANHASQGSIIFAAAPDQSDPTTFVTLVNALVAGNTASTIGFAVGGVETFVTSSTFADNSVDVVLTNDAQSSPSYLLNSIVRESSGTQTVSDPGNSMLDAECLMLNSGSGMPVDPTFVVGDPMFVDAAGGDYHLGEGSRAIDFCIETSGVPDTDLDGAPRGVDAPDVDPYLPGATYDLGAYAWRSDVIFADGFDNG